MAGIRQTGGEFVLVTESASDDLVEIQRYDFNHEFFKTRNIKSIDLVPVFTGATTSLNGIKGIVPAPEAGNQNLFLRADGIWADAHGSNQVYSVVQDDGVDITSRSVMNFIGASVVAADDAPNTRTNITFADTLNDIAGLSPTDGSIIIGNGTNYVSQSVKSGAYYVDTSNGNDTNTGSILFPLATIQEAIDLANTNSADIFVYAGTYTEDLSIGSTQSDIHIIGFGDHVNDSAIIDGTVLISGASNITFRNISLQKSLADIVTITNSNSISFMNCNLDTGGTIDNAFNISGTSSKVYIEDCSINGIVKSTASNTDEIRIVNQSSATCCIDLQGGVLGVYNCPQTGSITHGAGELTLWNIGRIVTQNSTTLASSADNSTGNKLRISKVNLQQSDDTYGTLSKTGNCTYFLDSTNYDPSTTLTGTRVNFTALANNINGNYSPTNYTAVTADVKGHLNGIDNALSGFSPFVWQVVTANTTMVPGNGYIVSGATKLTLTLPTTFSAGQVIKVAGFAGGWEIAQGGSQTIHWGNISTTTGSGKLTSGLDKDCVELVAATYSNDMIVTTASGNIDIT